MTHFIQHFKPLRAGRRLASAAAAFGALVAALVSTLSAAASPAVPAAAPGAVSADQQPAAQRYRVVNLGSGDITRFPQINGSGQVAFSLFDGRAPSAWTFDGKRIIPLGTLGGSSTYISGINEKGHVAGWSARSDEGIGIRGAFLWTAAGGLADLGSPGQVWAFANGINNGDAVVGSFGGYGFAHGFRWSAAAGMEDLGSFHESDAQAQAINDDGLIAGYAFGGNGRRVTFAWTRSGGLEDLGTLGGFASFPVAVGAAGEIAGESDTSGLNYTRHAYLWTRAGGMRDLGALDGMYSNVKAMSPNGTIVGTFYRTSTPLAMSWTATQGMVDLGTLGGASAEPGGINNLGQAVGAAADKSGTLRAFSWTRAQGMVDLNSRLVNAPAGLLLTKAHAVSDNGAIVASSNAGLVLLRPLKQEKLPAPVVGPIQLSPSGTACCAADMKVGFTDGDPAGQHGVTVDWGDAFMDTALVTEQAGVGSAAGHHVYQAPGLYTVAVRVSDRAGNATSVRRDLVVAGAGQSAVGSGHFQTPLGADPAAPLQAGTATFRFAAPTAQTGGMLNFVTARLLFRASTMSDAAKAAGAARLRQLAGTGQLNGKDGYRYALTVSGAAGDQAARFSLRISHTDSVTREEVTDFDNRQAGGSAVSEGAIAVAP